METRRRKLTVRAKLPKSFVFMRNPLIGGQLRIPLYRHSESRSSERQRSGAHRTIRHRTLRPRLLMDALAVVYARELTRWGIETSIIVPEAFTGGTNHFARAGSPADKAKGLCIDSRARAPTYFLTADSRSGMSKDLLWWRAPKSDG
jgi:hypothetical protein